MPYVGVDEVEEVAAWDVGQHEGLQRRLGDVPGGGGEEVQEGRDGGVRYVLPTAIKFKLGEGGRKGKGKGGGWFTHAQHLCLPLERERRHAVIARGDFDRHQQSRAVPIVVRVLREPDAAECAAPQGADEREGDGVVCAGYEGSRFEEWV